MQKSECYQNITAKLKMVFLDKVLLITKKK
jgi:hypothetical protein